MGAESDAPMYKGVFPFSKIGLVQNTLLKLT